MLSISRDEVENYLKSLGQSYREDVSNQDREFTRNWLRHEILPQVRRRVNPRLDQALGRLSDQARENQEFMNRLAKRELQQVEPEMTEFEIHLNVRRLRRRHVALLKEVLRLAWRNAGWPQQSMGAIHWEALANCVRAGGRCTLPGQVDGHCRRGVLVLRRHSS